MLECNDLILGYNNTALNSPFTLKLNDPSLWVGIIGENGTGKSTFLKTILGNIKPLSGNINISGNNNNRTIAYIPQEREINLSDKMSGLTFIKFAYLGFKYGIPNYNAKLNQKITELFHLVGAHEYMHQPFNTLSGGQKKRIYLAEALLNQPQLLLLDEPLADLDTKARQHFIQALQAIRQHHDLGVLIISHDMHEIAPHLDGFIHFHGKKIHYCHELPCASKDSYVGI